MRRPIQVPPKFQVPRVVVRAISDSLVDYGVPGTSSVDTDAIPFRERHASMVIARNRRFALAKS